LACDGQLPPLLDRGDALARVEAELLQHHEADQDQGNAADHRGIGPALAGSQPGVLLGVAEDRLLNLPQLGMAAFDATGRTLAAAFKNGTVLLWDVDPASWRTRACAVAGRELTRQEWHQFLPGRPYRATCPQPATAGR
jgi:hypothetical protein